MRPLPVSAAVGLAAFCLSASAHGQFAEPPSFAVVTPHPHDSGVFVNPGASVALVDSYRIAVLGAPSLRVFFHEIALGPDDYLDVVGLLDGEVHRIRPDEIAKWRSSSAFFNGGALELQLYVAPGSQASYTVSHLLVGTPGDPSESICFLADDRVPTTDARVGRFLDSSGTSACTGWLSGPDSCSFSAGHCFPSYASIAEFNVPLSTTGGALVHPPPEFQFPVDPASLIWNNGGIGNDYAICHLLTNTLGETASAKFGWFDLGFFFPALSETTRISGFGADSGTANQILQTHTGPFAGSSGFELRYTVDTQGGNSGSPVIHETSGDAIGIHTHGGCGSSGGHNSGTSLNLPAFLTDWEAACSHGTPGVPVADFSAAATTILESQSVTFVDKSTGVPTSWAWDFDEDGLVDSVLKSPTHTYPVEGAFDVTLTVSNSFGTDSVTFADFITVNPVAPTVMPYAQDFDGGLPFSGEWLFKSSNSFGAIAAGASGTASPVSGSPSLTMSSNTDASYVTNDSTLFVDASQHGGLSVRYWLKETSDEDHPEDGLYVSDGLKEVLVSSHQGAPSNWTQFTFDLGVLAKQQGVELGAGFRVVWRQHDNYPLGTDGHLVDDVSLIPVPHLAGDVASLSLSTGGVLTLELEAGLARANDAYWLLGSLSGTSPGTPIGSLVLPLNTPDPYFTLTLLHPNQPPLQASLGVLDAGGAAQATLTLPPGLDPGLTGVQVHHAYVAWEPASLVPTLVSNAEPLLLLP